LMTCRSLDMSVEENMVVGLLFRGAPPEASCPGTMLLARTKPAMFVYDCPKSRFLVADLSLQTAAGSCSFSASTSVLPPGAALCRASRHLARGRIAAAKKEASS
jgi:hypothetical protein